MGQSGHVSSSAKLCDDYTNPDYGIGIYSDWYLPSIAQLDQIYSARYILNKTIETIAGATVLNAIYLSSTEGLLYFGEWTLEFSSGYAHEYPKNTSGIRARAIRTF